MTNHEPGAYRHGPPYTPRQLRAVTRDALAAYAETASRGPAGAVALAALADLNRGARPDLREPYVYRVNLQPGLWLTVDASRNILLEVRTADESGLLAAYALSDVAEFRHSLDRAYSARDQADQDAERERVRSLSDAEWGRRLAAGMGPGEDADSRAAAVAEMLRAGLPVDSVYRVLRRAYGHLSGSFNVDGTEQPGTVTYDREHGAYHVRVPVIPRTQKAISRLGDQLPAPDYDPRFAERDRQRAERLSRLHESARLADPDPFRETRPCGGQERHSPHEYSGGGRWCEGIG